MKKKTFYWHDAIHDDFANNNIKTVIVPDNYKYFSRNIFYQLLEMILRIIVLPICYLIIKIGFHFKIKNKKVLKLTKGSGYFLYANHTSYLLDAYAPSIIAFPKKVHIIVNPDAISIKGLAGFVKLLGAIPVPTSIKGLARFKDVVTTLAEYKRVIMIYPEAHIWPYYTDIRPFGRQSFHYPIDCNLPSFAMTNVYVKRRFGKKPKVITYLDGPFYPDQNLERSERIAKLRDDIYKAMKKRVDSHPKYNFYEYVYVEDEKMVSIK